jgi:signal peptidase I
MPEAPPHYENHKLSLAAEVVRSGAQLRLRVQGTSMLPSLWPGDVLRIENDGPEISPGEIVLAEREGRFFVHRLVRRTEREGSVYWITRGDSMPSDDRAVATSDVLGRVSAVERRNVLIFPCRKVSQLRHLLAWTLCHCGLVRRIALRVHATRIRRETKAAQLVCHEVPR